MNPTQKKKNKQKNLKASFCGLEKKRWTAVSLFFSVSNELWASLLEWSLWFSPYFYIHTAHLKSRHNRGVWSHGSVWHSWRTCSEVSPLFTQRHSFVWNQSMYLSIYVIYLSGAYAIKKGSPFYSVWACFFYVSRFSWSVWSVS